MFQTGISARYMYININVLFKDLHQYQYTL